MQRDVVEHAWQLLKLLQGSSQLQRGGDVAGDITPATVAFSHRLVAADHSHAAPFTAHSLQSWKRAQKPALKCSHSCTSVVAAADGHLPLGWQRPPQ